MEKYQNQMADTMTSDRGILTGMFADRESAENTYNTLRERGYTKDEINLIMSNETRKKYFFGNLTEITIGTKAAQGAGKSSAIGDTIGAIGAIADAVGTSLIIPGLGIVIAGPIAAGLVGAGTGAITDGIIGALVGSGIPEERAKLYELGIQKGHIIIGVYPHNEEDAEYIEKSWHTNKDQEVSR